MIGDDGKHLNPALFTTRDERVNARVLGLLTGDLVATQHQPTKSSRSGTIEAYTTYRRRLRIAVCSKCHRLRTDLGGPHAPHFNDNNERVDCVGDLVDGAAS